MTTFLTEKINSILLPYQQEIEGKIKKHIDAIGQKNLLRDACEYALLVGGKRFRPTLVLMIAKALGNNDVTNPALAIEFFHTASLIADDLPCMDNESLRRNKPTTHTQYNEATAILATYALIASGYKLLTYNPEVSLIAIQNISDNTGADGATGGQFLDLYETDRSPQPVLNIIHKKTTTLFESSFVLGWLYGGGDVNKLPLVKQASHHFGKAFQIADDLQDMQQDILNDKPNFAVATSAEHALKTLKEEIHSFRAALEKLGLAHSELTSLADLLT
jgi:geranylgeranyl diphosphate synthase type II